MTDTATTEEMLAQRNGELVLRVKRLEEALEGIFKRIDTTLGANSNTVWFACWPEVIKARAALRKGEA